MEGKPVKSFLVIVARRAEEPATNLHRAQNSSKGQESSVGMRLDGVLPWPPQRQCPRSPGSDALQGRVKQSPTFKTKQAERHKYQLSVLFCEGHSCSHLNTSTLQCQVLRHSALRCIAFRLWQGEAGSQLGAVVLDSEGSVLLPAVAHGWLPLEAVSNSSFQ